MEHKFLKLYKDGVWTGRHDRKITVEGVEHDLDDYAQAHGIELPDAKKSKKKINIDKQDHSYGDMERQDHRSDKDVDGEGDSQSTE